MHFSRKTRRSRNNGSSKPDIATPRDCDPCQSAEPEGYYKSRSKPKPNRHRYLPKNTTCTAATATTMSTAATMSSRSVYSSASVPTTAQHDMCPVTGVYANIANDYYISPDVIGKGHYGIVRECIHRATRQKLAVKTIEKSKVSRLDHLQREIFLLASIDHRSIMKMVDCYEDAKYVHIITEKYTGGELFDKIVENSSSYGCLSERKTAEIIKSLLEAVMYLHENGVVHRDIKPENILFESTMENSPVKLIDFGLARTHKRGEAPMTNAVGTAYYMSPELLRGKYDKSTDIWSIGVVAYVLLSGFPPFNGNSDKEIQSAARKGKVHFKGSGWLNKSDDAMDLIKCVLRRDPQKRFTAKEALGHPWIRTMAAF